MLRSHKIIPLVTVSVTWPGVNAYTTECHLAPAMMAFPPNHNGLSYYDGFFACLEVMTCADESAGECDNDCDLTEI